MAADEDYYSETPLLRTMVLSNKTILNNRFWAQQYHRAQHLTLAIASISALRRAYNVHAKLLQNYSCNWTIWQNLRNPVKNSLNYNAKKRTCL